MGSFRHIKRIPPRVQTNKQKRSSDRINLPSIAAFDFGIKYNILRKLAGRGLKVAVFPSRTNADTVLSGGYDGIFLSNGPGDPEAVTYAIDTIRQLLGKKPIFGICLGHQLLGLALGRTYIQTQIRAPRRKSAGHGYYHR